MSSPTEMIGQIKEIVEVALGPIKEILNKVLPNGFDEEASKKNQSPFAPLLYLFGTLTVGLGLIYWRGVLSDRAFGKAIEEIFKTRTTVDIITLTKEERIWQWMSHNSAEHQFCLIYSALVLFALFIFIAIVVAWSSYPEYLLMGKKAEFSQPRPGEPQPTALSPTPQTDNNNTPQTPVNP